MQGCKYSERHGCNTIVSTVEIAVVILVSYAENVPQRLGRRDSDNLQFLYSRLLLQQ